MDNNVRKRSSEREAAAYVRSLASEGYVIKVHYKPSNESDGFCSLHHSRNGNIIHVYVRSDAWTVYKNGVLILHENL